MFLISLINSSLTSGLIPASFKTARIKPLLKKPTLDTTDIHNYTTTLLPFLSETLEHASYLSQNNLLDPHQSVFKTAHSTETAQLAVTESLRAARASSLSLFPVLLDLSATFVTVNHKIHCASPLHLLYSYLSSSRTFWASPINRSLICRTS